ncbi:MAG TPA: DNA topoisomerase, partial [Paenisporosarcina sp.]|nr:DNA topoisomerase [Paenisporosarcina sp.]
MKTLIVVESPSKAKTIAKYLGANYIVRASYGHIFDLVTGKGHGVGVDIENNFTPKYGLISDKKDKLETILDAAKSCDLVLLASDPDREGEGIACLLANAIKIKIPVRRVLFHEITKKGVNEGIAKPQDLNKDLFDAQQARRVLDRLVGFMVSPFLMDSIGPNLSAGRVQSITVRLIVDREREIENFKPEEYWSITATLAKPNMLTEKFVARYTNKVTNKTDATKIKMDLDNDSYQVIDVIAEEKAKKPFPPLATASLQQAASRKYKLSSDRTMKAAQALYESGLVTYIRTDSIRCSPESINDLRCWLKENGHSVPENPVFYVAKGNAQDAHEAIRPTDVE